MRLGDTLGNVTLHVFDDYDGVIDDQSGSEGDAEQSQSIDGEAKDLHENKCADERDGDGDGGNQGAAPVLKKHIDHEDDQQEIQPEDDQKAGIDT